MYDNFYLRKEDLVNNPTPRVPVCLCLDVSDSMAGYPIRELNSGVELFYKELRSDIVARYSAEICIITYGGQVSCALDFASLEAQEEPPLFRATGLTPMGEAVNLALDQLERRKNEYKEYGVDYFQPWLVLMTDGIPNGDSKELVRAMERCTNLVQQKKLTIFPIGIGPNADMNTLKCFSPKRSPVKLKEFRFSDFFSWLSKSVSRTSQSIPGEKVELDIEGLKGWCEL